MQLRIIILLVIAVLVSIFALANPAAVDINLIFWHIKSVSLALVILACLLCGALIVWLFSSWDILGKNLQIKQLKEKLSQFQQSQEKGE